MSKFTKMLRDPRRFVLDSRAYRRLHQTVSGAALPGQPLVELRLRLVKEDPALQEAMRAQFVDAVPSLELQNYPGLYLAVLRDDLCTLSEHLFEISRKPGLKLVLQAGKRGIDVSTSYLVALDDFLAKVDAFVANVRRASDGRGAVLNVQLWKDMGSFVEGPRRTPIARRISRRAVEEHQMFRAGQRSRARDLHAQPLGTDVTFPVDAVYTWVNNRDPKWQRLWTAAVGAPPKSQRDDSKSIDRYMNRDELRYSLRSIAYNAPWLRKIFVVTNCSRPDWLQDHPKLVWVDHEEIISDRCLPTFSSHAIESRLQHIPDLTNHFLYFNDDMFLLRPTTPDEFFHGNGLSKAFMEEWGAVNGAVDPEDPDYLNAARNGKRILEKSFGRSVTALHKHTPYALRKDVLLEMEERFSEPIARTTANAFRTPDDISTVSFFYHHYAYLTGRATYEPSTALLIKPQTPSYEARLEQILSGELKPISLCLNDGDGSVGFSHWDRHVVEFLTEYFSDPCVFDDPSAPPAPCRHGEMVEYCVTCRGDDEQRAARHDREEAIV
jgi:hypothetical protein